MKLSFPAFPIIASVAAMASITPLLFESNPFAAGGIFGFSAAIIFCALLIYYSPLNKED